MNTESKAKNYQSIKHKLFVFNLLFDFCLLVLFFISGWSFDVVNFARTVSSNIFVINALYICIFSVGMYIIHFPISYYSGYTLEHKFDLSVQKFREWLWDDFKKSLIGLIIALVAIEVIYVFLARFSHNWWIWAAIFWLLLTFVLAKLTPNVLIPLFYKYSDIEDDSLRNQIMNLFKNCQVSLKNIYSIDLSTKTKKANAFLCGVGKNRRVVLSDTLLKGFSNDEIEVVVAHELGHYKHKDIIKLLFVNAGSTFVGLFLISQFLEFALEYMGLTRIDDIGFFPMLVVALMCFSLVAMPLMNGYSRMIERHADHFSLEHTNKANEFISVMEKLGQMNLAQMRPSWLVEFFFYDHPPLYKRIAFARNFRNT